MGIVNLVTVSANVLPRHTLLPPKNGPNVIGFLGLPEGVKYQSTNFGSNRSGTNLLGSFH
jgi:hypothetical protein